MKAAITVRDGHVTFDFMAESSRGDQKLAALWRTLTRGWELETCKQWPEGGLSVTLIPAAPDPEIPPPRRTEYDE